MTLLAAGVAQLYVCVHVPEFAAQALLRHRRELTKKAVAVMAGVSPLEKVCSLNKLAARAGVEAGMTKGELEAFPGLTVLRRSEEEEAAARGALLETAGLFTPRVEVWREAVASGSRAAVVGSAGFGAVLDMTGSGRVFGPLGTMVRRLAAKLGGLHLTVRVAASANVHAAVCVAPWARRGPVVIEQGREAEVLAGLPLHALGLTATQAETLQLWGLRTVGELARLPEVELVVRLGQEGKRLRRLARGEHPHLMVPEEPVFALVEFTEFEAPVEILESLLFAVGPMLGQLLARAGDRALALASVTLRLELDGGGEHERTVKPALPVMDREVLLKLLHLDLQAHPPPAAVVNVRVSAEPGDRSKVQMGLYAPPVPEAMRLDVTLARIAALVGEGRVGRARLLDSHRAESFAMERFAVAPGTAKDYGPRQGLGQALAMRRCRPPVEIAVRRERGRLEGFALRGRQYAVREAFGPWRRSGEWWSPEVWSREEWDVCGEAGEGGTLLCVIAHDLLRDRWEMEGLYD